MNEEPTGNIHVYTGDGKGKTTAAFGLAMRASGRGLSVLIVQFLKKGPDFGEVISAQLLPRIKVEQYGTGWFINEKDITDEDRKLAREGMARAKEAIRTAEAELIVLDEINVAMYFKLIRTEEVLELIASKPKRVELVLTGRRAPKEIMKRADYVTEMRKKKHPFDIGQEGRPGIEF